MSKRNAFDKKLDERMNRPEESGFVGSISNDVLGELAALGKQDALAVIGSKEIRVGVFLWTPVGLQLEGKPNRGDWEETGRILKLMNSSLQWLIGDLIVMGEGSNYGDQKVIAEKFGFDEGTIYNYSYVCRSIEISLRSEILSFGHHQLVAPLSPEKQNEWLRRAEMERWSIARLRKEISGVVEDDSEPQTYFTKVMTRLPSEFSPKAVKAMSEAEKQQLRERLRALLSQIK